MKLLTCFNRNNVIPGILIKSWLDMRSYRLMRISVILILMICAICNVYSQSVSPSGMITGKAIDKTRTPVAFAAVSLLKITNKDSVAVKGILTAENGEFRFEGLVAGNYAIKIVTTGYNKFVKGDIAIEPHQPVVELNEIELTQHVIALGPILVSANKPLIDRQIYKVVLNVEGSILAAGNSALEILERAPGVSVDNLGNIGMKGRQGVLLMIDGKPTYLSRDQVLSLLRATDGSSIQAIELITNPSSKYDAAGNSGIINIRMKKFKLRNKWKCESRSGIWQLP